MNYIKTLRTLVFIDLSIFLLVSLTALSAIGNIEQYNLFFLIAPILFIFLINFVAYYGVYKFRNYGRVLYSFITISFILTPFYLGVTEQTNALYEVLDGMATLFNGILIAMCWLPIEAKLAFKSRDVELSELEKDALTNLENGQPIEEVRNTLLSKGVSESLASTTLDNASLELNRRKSIDSGINKILWAVGFLVVGMILLAFISQIDLGNYHGNKRSLGKGALFILWLLGAGVYKLFEGLFLFEKYAAPVPTIENMLSIDKLESSNLVPNISSETAQVSIDTTQENNNRASDKKDGGFSKLWNGDLGLAKTYWLYATLLPNITLFLIVGILALLASSSVFQLFADIFIIFILIINIFQLVAFVGVWRAGSKYQGSKLWVILSRIMVVIGSFSTIIYTISGFIGFLKG